MKVQSYEIDDDLNIAYKGRKEAGHIKGYETEHVYSVPLDVWTALAVALFNIDNAKPDDYLFPIRYNTLNDTVKKYAEEIGLDGKQYSTHSLRATAATNLYIMTHDIYQVQTLLHHTDVKMTMQYIKDLDIDEKLKESLNY